MKFGLWTANGALNSKPVFESFKKGILKLGHSIVENQFGDIDVIWSILWHGRMSKNKHIFETAKKNKKNIIVLEVGGLKRGITWKLGLNGINRDAYFGPTNNDNKRIHSLNINLKEWQNNNDGPILIAAQHKFSGQWSNPHQMDEWILNSIKEIRLHTQKKIIIRSHPRCPIKINTSNFTNVFFEQPKKINGTYDDFDFNPNNAYAIVNWSSNPGIHSAINGIPIFTGPSSLAWPVANQSFKTILNPKLPNRVQWLNDLAYTEWTIDEISSGTPLSRLTNKL